VSGYLSPAEQHELSRELPWGDEFLRRYEGMSADELRSLQEIRFRRLVEAAWDTAFYRRLWSEAGLQPGDLKDLDCLPLLPLVDKQMLVADIEENPPYGSLPRRITAPVTAQVLQTTSGTTGQPQPVLWGAWGREAQNALLGRTYRWLGIGAGDLVHSVYGHGPVNGGHYVREAVNRYTDALMLTAGAGSETRSDRQVAFMAQFRPTVLVGFADYLRRLAEVARESGVSPGEDIPVRLVVGQLPQGSRQLVENDWPGSRAFDWYGVADTGVVAAEGPDAHGLWIWEDAHLVEVLAEDGASAAPGIDGDLVVTSLSKWDVAPLVRFNTHDRTRILPDASPIGLPFRRMAGFLGRSDQMVKLRGINVYPTAIAAIIAALPELSGATGEYVCRLERRADGADHLVVVMETRRPVADQLVEELLTRSLGVRVGVEQVPPGATAEITGVGSRQKPLRLVDGR
jgi:phenylacetate-CoA ligase